MSAFVLSERNAETMFQGEFSHHGAERLRDGQSKITTKVWVALVAAEAFRNKLPHRHGARKIELTFRDIVGGNDCDAGRAVCPNISRGGTVSHLAHLPGKALVILRVIPLRLNDVVAVRRPFPPQNLLSNVATSLKAVGLKKKPRLPKAELFEAELAELKRMAAAREGTLVSQRYIGGEPHEWKCATTEHPTWFAEPSRIKRGAWCPSCAGNRKLDIVELRRWGEAHGLRLIAKEYAGAQAVYSWRCTNGHLVHRSKGNIAASVRNGRAACSICKKAKSR